MAIPFTSATQNLFNVLGRLGGMAKLLGAYQASLYTLMTDQSTGLEAQLSNESDVQALMGSNYVSLLNATGGNVSSMAQSIASAITSRKVFRDNAQLNQTLTSANTTTSVLEVIRQMKLAGAAVLAQTITATPQAFVGVGNGVVVCSTKRPSDGRVLENAFGETITFTCSADSYLNGAQAGNESFSVTSQGSQGDYFAFDWPLGSNCNTSLQAINGNADNSQGNFLTNSGFETFTVANTPDDWPILLGAAGTDFFEEDSIVYDPTSGGKSLRWQGDGSTVLTTRQGFGVDPGTQGTLDALTQYSLCCFLRRSGSVPSGGVLEFSLTDVNGVVLSDAAGNQNLFTVPLTSLTTNFLSFTGTFRTPLVMPATTYLRVRTSTPYDNGLSFYLDKVSLGQMTQTYTAGPYVAVHAGSTPFVSGDYSYAFVTNSRGAAGTLNTWQTLLARLFPSQAYSQGILFPSSSTPTISDTLIT